LKSKDKVIIVSSIKKGLEALPVKINGIPEYYREGGIIIFFSA
jgi:hypothetical protein